MTILLCTHAMSDSNVWLVLLLAAMMAGFSVQEPARPQRRSDRTPNSLNRGRGQLCSPKAIDANWDLIKHRAISLTSQQNIDPGLFLYSKSSWSIPIKWCRSEVTPCSRSRMTCSPGPMGKKTTALAVSSTNHRLLVSLDYLEAKQCLCKADTSAVDLFPIITKVSVAKRCTYTGINSNIPVVADEGKNITLSFPYASPMKEDAPSTIMILKAFEQERPFIIDFMIRIKNTQNYDDPDDWRTRVSVSFARGAVELILENVTHTDEGTYLCKVEFLNSSSCFSTAELSVLGTASDEEKTGCQPQMMKPSWATFGHLTRYNDAPVPMPLNESLAQDFLVQKCLSAKSPCQAVDRQCLSATTQEKQRTFCVPDEHSDDLTRVEVHYIEDETCSCGPREVFQKDSFWDETVHITSMKEVGTCSDECQPEYAVVKWRDLKEYLNKWTSLNISDVVEGQDLKVKKCHQSLTPCRNPGSFCEVAEKVKIRKRIKLKNVNLKINLKLFEASKCECKKLDKPTQDLTQVNSPPVITYAKVKILRAKKSGKSLA